MSKLKLTEARLREALQRLLEGSSIRTKVSGKLTLNKINNEAGLGNSYIHKFKDLVKEFTPIINDYNAKKDAVLDQGIILPSVVLTPVELLKIDFKREKKLKELYRQQRDNARKAQKELEVIHNTLLFRIYDLQEELRPIKVIPINSDM